MADVNTITVGHTVKLNIVVMNNESVLTLNMIDLAHGRPKGTASNRFGENRSRFVEGKHYHMVTYAQADELRPYGVEVPPRGLTLITKRGYLLLVKSFTDDLAWEVQEQLVDFYFESQAQNRSNQQPTITAKQLQAVREEMVNCTRYLHHCSASLAQTLYLQMKREFGYDKIEHMPLSQYEKAILWIRKYQPICHQVYDVSCFVEREFMRRVKEQDYEDMADMPKGILDTYHSQTLIAQ